jgi:hypothetical protein
MLGTHAKCTKALSHFLAFQVLIPGERFDVIWRAREKSRITYQSDPAFARWGLYFSKRSKRARALIGFEM